MSLLTWHEMFTLSNSIYSASIWPCTLSGARLAVPKVWELTGTTLIHVNVASLLFFHYKLDGTATLGCKLKVWGCVVKFLRSWPTLKPFHTIPTRLNVNHTEVFNAMLIMLQTNKTAVQARSSRHLHTYWLTDSFVTYMKRENYGCVSIGI